MIGPYGFNDIPPPDKVIGWIIWMAFLGLTLLIFLRVKSAGLTKAMLISVLTGFAAAAFIGFLAKTSGYWVQGEVESALVPVMLTSLGLAFAALLALVGKKILRHG